MLGHHQVTEKPSHFSSQREESQKAQIEITLTSSVEQSRIRERNHSLKLITITQRFLFMKIANEMK